MRTTRTLLALAAVLVTANARAETVEASSTTYVSAGKQPRGGPVGQAPDLVNVMPVIEVVTISARGIKNRLFDDLDVVLSTWGAYDVADVRWDAGTTGQATGDVVTGYVKGRLWSRRLTLRLGRQAVVAGVGRVATIDGIDAALRLPLGLSLSGYAGVPVSQRFSMRGAAGSWNPLGGDFAYGGRAAWAIAFPGATAAGFELGASAAFVDDGSQAVRRDAGVDARLQFFKDLALTGNAVYAIEDQRLAEAAALLTWHPIRRLFLTADYRNSAPDLMLPRNSILSVFADATRTEAGGGFRFEITESLEAGADYHALLESEGKMGQEAALKGDYAHGPMKAGAELTWLDTPADNGYSGARFYARRDMGAFFAAGDVMAYVFKEKINKQDYSASAGATAGLTLGKGWTASVTARAATTPFMESQVDVMAKLAYNQTYRVREVR
jgi:hypothetical protein